jgi:butyrate kinase
MDRRLILAINPGSTSTKFSLFEENKLLFEKLLRHAPEELSRFARIPDQFDFRKELILGELRTRNVDMTEIKVVVGRGGLIKPMESGVYNISSLMKEHLQSEAYGSHACNLGALIADDIAASLPNAVAYTVDPVVVDELEPVARIAGHPEFERKSVFHALNQKAVARLYASAVNRNYEDLNLIVAHLGGGVSIGAHRHGRVIDVNNALNGEGPFTPERSGSLPSGQLADLCFSGRFQKPAVLSMLTGRGGMMAYLGTNDYAEVCRRALSGDESARLIRDAFIYQVIKEIGSMSAVLHGNVDAIILTGGISYNEGTVNSIRDAVKYIADVAVYPGEDEMKALAFNGLLALDGKVEIRNYN